MPNIRYGKVPYMQERIPAYRAGRTDIPARPTKARQAYKRESSKAAPTHIIPPANLAVRVRAYLLPEAAICTAEGLPLCGERTWRRFKILLLSSVSARQSYRYDRGW
jgi:hypothetical protein